MDDAFRQVAADLCEATKASLGDRLVAFAVFGSVARARAKETSDLDVLMVIRELPRGPPQRRRIVAGPVDAAEVTLQRSLPLAVISEVLKTPEEVRMGGPIFLDMTVPAEVAILHDPNGFLSDYLAGLRTRMTALGSVRRVCNGAPYWDLKPDWRPGDVVEL